MGCAAGAQARSTLRAPRGASTRPTVSGPRFPDVSDWQGHPDWQAARPYIVGAVVKAFETSVDPDFAWNVAELKKLGLPWAPYDFVRSCNAAGFIAAVRAVGGLTSLPAVIDEEVPAADGCTQTLAGQIHAAFGRWPVEYTSPGTETSGAGTDDLGLWIADYGSSFPCLWTCHPVAWQFASPPFVYSYLPGLGYGDVSVDYGFTRLLPAKPTPKPVVPDPHRLLAFPTFTIATPYGDTSERTAMARYYGARAHPAQYAGYLHGTLEPLERWLADRIAALVLGHPPVRWGLYGRGVRFQRQIHAAQGDASP
jgi:hypothetical protein